MSTYSLALIKVGDKGIVLAEVKAVNLMDEEDEVLFGNDRNVIMIPAYPEGQSSPKNDRISEVLEKAINTPGTPLGWQSVMVLLVEAMKAVKKESRAE